MDGLDGPPNRRSSPQRTPRPRREQGTDHPARRDRTGPGGVRHPGCCRVQWVSVDGVLAAAHGHGLLTVVVVVASNALGGPEIGRAEVRARGWQDGKIWGDALLLTK